MQKLLTVILVLLSCSCNGQTDTFFCTWAVQTYTVSIGTTSIYVDIRGATGGTNSLGGSRGGNGGRVQCELSVSPGQVLYVYVGGGGYPMPPSFGGGGSGGSSWCFSLPGFLATGSGGGASDIRIGGTSLANRVVVAGGGGGASCDTASPYIDSNRGGDGGGLIGESGWADNSNTNGRGGGGGTQFAGGAGGVAIGLPSGMAGGLGVGGHGGFGSTTDTTYYSENGGGGGGGYYGGGGGARSGGGGGSSFADPTLCRNVFHTRGYNSHGDGIVIISTTTGINDPFSKLGLNIYPNPATTTLTIQSTNQQINQLTITNLLGQTVHTHQYNTTQAEVDVSALPAGVYFVRINGTEVRKFVKE